MKRKLVLILFFLLLLSSGLTVPFPHFPSEEKQALAQTCRDNDSICSKGCTLENDNDCPPTVEYYKTSYQTLKDHLVDTNRIQIMTEKTVLSEHGNSNIVGDKVFSGHMGGFWAPPFFSAGITAENGFHMGLGFYDRDSGNYKWEEESDLATEAFWYPSKMVVTKTYPGGDKDHQITGTKVTIPGYRAFGLKLKVENVGTKPSHMNILFFVSIPGVKRLTTQTHYGWIWGEKDCDGSNFCSSTGIAEKDNDFFVLFNAEEQFCMGLGIGKPAGSWRIVNGDSRSRKNLINDFTDDGRLSSTDEDGPSNGTIIGIIYEAPETNPNESYTVPFVAVIEQSAGLNECKRKLRNSYNYIIDQDIERMADDYWNTRLEQMYSQLPHLEIGDERLKRIYHNSSLHLSLNKLQADDLITGNFGYDSYYSLASFFGKSMGEFPWADARHSYVRALTDPDGLKHQIIKYLNLESSNPEACRAYDPVAGNHFM